MAQQFYCEKCHKTMSETQFYTLKTGEKAPLCKKCLTMHIDNFDDSTYKWVLEMLDLPYVPVEWNKIREKAWAKGAEKMNGMSVLGKYISLMKLKQWRSYGWADTERIATELVEKAAAYDASHPERVEAREEIRKKFEAGEISEAQYKTLTNADDQLEDLEADPAYLEALYAGTNSAGIGMYGVPQNQIFMQESELPDPSADLTDEDKIYLAMKWGREWQPNDWIALEKTYNEYMESFDVQDADTRNNILLICQTYHKMNSALRVGDFDAFAKLNRAYESLRKTAKLTAQQNKDEKGNFADCLGTMVVICEQEGFIARFATDQPNDLIDKIIVDMNNFTATFARDNLNLQQSLDMFLKRIEIQKQMEEQEDNLEEFTEADFVEYYDQQEEAQAQDLIEAESDF